MDVDGKGVGGFENYTIFMNIICVSFLTVIIYVDGKGTVFPVNCLNKDIKKKILKRI